MIDLGSILSDPQSVGDVLRGSTRITLGGTDYEVRARSIEGDEQWLAGLETELRELLAAVEQAGDDKARILALLTAFPDELLTALVEYDQHDILPSRDELRGKASSAELLVAVARVWRLANPLAAIGASALMKARLTSRRTGTSGKRTTTSRRSGAGRSPASGPS